MLLPLSIYIVLKIPTTKIRRKIVCHNVLLRKNLFVDGIVVFLEITRNQWKNYEHELG